MTKMSLLYLFVVNQDVNLVLIYKWCSYIAIRKHVKWITAWVNFVANLNEQMNLQLEN